jgi:O-acetyl-ADP-ribose deacetylase (regulator of RNase III)
MTFVERTGDLFEADDLDAIAHGVNCRGVMGAGIALEFKNRFPENYKNYLRWCKSGYLHPGGLMVLRIVNDPGPLVFNLASQDKPGPHAKYRWVASSVAKMLDEAENPEGKIKRIGIPQIGCGIGGLEWHHVRELLRLVAGDSPIELVVFSL